LTAEQSWPSTLPPLPLLRPPFLDVYFSPPPRTSPPPPQFFFDLPFIGHLNPPPLLYSASCALAAASRSILFSTNSDAEPTYSRNLSILRETSLVQLSPRPTPQRNTIEPTLFTPAGNLCRAFSPSAVIPLPAPPLGPSYACSQPSPPHSPGAKLSSVEGRCNNACSAPPFSPIFRGLAWTFLMDYYSEVFFPQSAWSSPLTDPTQSCISLVFLGYAPFFHPVKVVAKFPYLRCGFLLALFLVFLPLDFSTHALPQRESPQRYVSF